jgi:hypothetical protein
VLLFEHYCLRPLESSAQRKTPTIKATDYQRLTPRQLLETELDGGRLAGNLATFCANLSCSQKALELGTS